MKRTIIVTLVIGAAAAASAWLIGHPPLHPAGASAAGPAGAGSPNVAAPVPVGITAVVRGTFNRSLVAYGQIGVAPEAIHGVSVPYDCVVDRITCAIGQTVHRGDALIDVEPGADVRQQLAEAQLSRTSAEQDLALVKQRLGLSLATQTEVALAQHLFDAADRHVVLLIQRTSGEDLTVHHLVAPIDGKVMAIAVKSGVAAAAGTDLIDVAPSDRREVRLGIAAGDAAAFHAGQALSLQSLGGSPDATTMGTVTWITSTLDPTTRLIDVVVAVPAGSRDLDGESVVARIPVSIPDVLIVPRSALVSDDNGTKVFAVTLGRAERTLVTVIAESDIQAALSGQDLTAGMEIVTDGASIIDDGQAVRAVPASPTDHRPGPAPASPVRAP